MSETKKVPTADDPAAVSYPVRDKSKRIRQPMQPVVFDEHGVIRFQANQMVKILLREAHKRDFTLNDLHIAAQDEAIPRGDREQFDQLIGYSVSGVGDMDYWRRSQVQRADVKAHELVQKRMPQEPDETGEERWGYADDPNPDNWQGACRTREQAIKEGRASFGKERFFIASGHVPSPAQFMPSAPDILDQAQQSADDDAGDAAESFGAADEEAMDELNDVIEKWAKKHLRCSFWIGGHDPEEITPLESALSDLDTKPAPELSLHPSDPQGGKGGGVGHDGDEPSTPDLEG